MINYSYLLVGLLLLLLVGVDLLWTTLWVEGGAGPLTAQVMAWTWHSLRSVADNRPQFLSISGPLILVCSLTVWISLLWVGWTFVFAGAETSLIDTRDTGPVSWIERFYFVGYSVFTMGNGDFTPQDGIWMIVTSFTTASGMLFVTLSVTYVLSVLGAVTQKRSLASNISGLGTQSIEILETSWDGEKFDGLGVPLNTVSSELDVLTSNHKAYPILHYFYTPDPTAAPATAVTVFDEMLTLLKFGVPEENRPSEIAIKQSRTSVRTYLQTLDSAFVEPADETPPTPRISVLRDVGVPTVSNEEFEDAIADLEDRRRKLLGLLRADERQWPRSEDG